MAIKDTKEADLRPVHVKCSLVLGLEDIENNANTIFVILPDNALVCVGSIGLDDAAFLLTCFGGFMVFKMNSLWI